MSASLRFLVKTKQKMSGVKPDQSFFYPPFPTRSYIVLFSFSTYYNAVITNIAYEFKCNQFATIVLSKKILLGSLVHRMYTFRHPFSALDLSMVCGIVVLEELFIFFR